MTDRPIIFSALMVRALLESRKTMTRRLLNPQPQEDVGLWLAEGHKLPYAVGDRLYVRETFYETDKLTRFGVIDGVPVPAVFRADWPESEWRFAKWTPPIHMPKDYSRITLTVTAVKVERLQDISEEDAIAEGVEKVFKDWDKIEDDDPFGWKDYRYGHPHAVVPYAKATKSFESLWQSLNAKRAPWNSNPWVVAVSFAVHKQNIDALKSVTT